MHVVTHTKKADPSLPRIALALLRHYLGGRRGLVLLTVAALTTGLVLNWSWLVAVGVAPLLLALAPCAAMCALGLCAHKLTNKSDAAQPGPAQSGSDLMANTSATPPIAAAGKPDHESKS